MKPAITKNKELEINEEDIFSQDQLSREVEIKNLSSLIESTTEASTIAINADWGSGKTTFVKLWKEYLKKEHGINSIYFSAWEDDFSKEPLISILGEINGYISDNFEKKGKVVDNFNKVKGFASKVVKRGLPAFVKGTTAGMIDIDKGFESAVSAIAEEATKGLIENYSKEKALTKSFQESIQQLLKSLDSDKPFVIFIDELDRCRPLYAIELLERVKHIFGIDGLVFVLSIDKKELAKSIQSQYGDINAEGYLRRFIDIEYNLKKTERDVFCRYLYDKKYKVSEILHSKGVGVGVGTHIDDFVPYSVNEVVEYLVESLDLSLREIEQVFIQINIVFKVIKPYSFNLYIRVIVFFIVLKIKRQDIYFGLINRSIPVEKIIDTILLNKEEKEGSKKNIRITIKSIVYATSVTDQELTNIAKQQAEISDIESNDQERLVTLLKYDYRGWDNNYKNYKLNDIVKIVIEKVEFLGSFNFEESK
ncbi:MAG: hypothetical protein FE834_06200 [Gammaproteobacteria bacterium]|nr:hypothetical protein [Gammaproteobacteria bacterium]